MAEAPTSYSGLTRDEEFEIVKRALAGNVEASRWVLANLPPNLFQPSALESLRANAGQPATTAGGDTQGAPRTTPGVELGPGVEIRWWAVAEFAPAAFAFWMIWVWHRESFEWERNWAGGDELRFDPDATLNGRIGLGLIWTIAPLILAPLTFPGRSQQQRATLVALISGAAVSWWMLLGPGSERWDYPANGNLSALGVLLVLGFMAAAVIARLGWGPIRFDRPRLIAQHPKDLAAPPITENR